MIGHNMTSCVGCTLVAKSPRCHAADYNAPAKPMLLKIEFKPSASWTFCTHPPPNYYPAKGVWLGSVLILVLKCDCKLSWHVRDLFAMYINTVWGPAC